MAEAASKTTGAPGRGDSPAVRVCLQSGDRLRREALAAYLDTLSGFTVCGRVASPDDVLALCPLEHPDLVLLDAGRDAGPVVSACDVLRTRYPGVRVVLTYERLGTADVSAVQSAGVAAVVPNSRGLAALVSVLRQASTGISTPLSSAGLSDRQREILLLMASGHSAIEIAELLGISPGTVENHKRRLYAKLQATSAVHAIARAASFGIMDDPPAAGLPPVDRPDGRRQNGGPPQHSSAEAGRPPLVVAAGRGREDLDRVVEALIVHSVPVFREHHSGAPRYGHWWRWHHGPVIRVLVNPTAHEWSVGTSFGRTTVVVHSGPLIHGMLTAALANGAVAVVPAEDVPDLLVPVLRLAARGYLVLDQSLSSAVFSPAGPGYAQRRPQPPALTSREHDILRSIGRSYTVRQTAIRLGIAVKTVENTQGHLFRKLGVHNRAEALASAYSLGLLQPGDRGPGDNGQPARDTHSLGDIRRRR